MINNLRKHILEKMIKGYLAIFFKEKRKNKEDCTLAKNNYNDEQARSPKDHTHKARRKCIRDKDEATN
jgi:hypothetical protein